MASMKRSLDESKIVNRKLMLSVMKQKSSWLNNFVLVEVISLPLLFLLILCECLVLDISVWFAIVCLVGSAIDVVADLKTTLVRPSDFSKLDMLSLRRKLMKQKRQRYIQLIVTLPLGMIWGAWFVYECVRSIIGADFVVGGTLFWIDIALVGVVLVATIVVVMAIYRKIQSVNDDIITTIDESDM